MRKHKLQKAKTQAVGVEMLLKDMNRQQRRAHKSKTQGNYIGLAKPTDNGKLNASRKTGGTGY